MGVLSSFNVIFVRITFLSTLAFFCLKDVNIMLKHSFVVVLTQAMNLPALTLSSHSAQLGLFSILFILMATNDLIPLLEKNKKYFESIVPVRLMLFFVLTGLSYYLEDNLYLHNNAVFIYSFCEVWINFLIFSAVREERNSDIERDNQFMDSQLIGEEESEFPISTTQQIEQITDDEGEYEE